MTPAKKRRKTGNDGLCLFCTSGADNPQTFGQRLEKDGITVHYFCMLFASGLSQNGKSDKEGILGFLMRDIFCEVKRGRRLRCTYCKKTGATVGCVKSNCRRAFHFGCGRENGALSQFFGNFSSYCQDHCPKQVVPVRDRQVFHGTANSICAICMCAVEARASNSTLRAPCCKNAWFHRNCMQRQAIYSGIHFFKCALCNNKDMFQDEMLTFGIYIPDQDAAWELEPNAYHDLLERHSQCDVKRCLCNQGRRYNKDSSNWEIILCDWCGSKGTHIICSAVNSSGTNWICEDCSNVASKMGSTKKTSHSKKPQIDEWIKKKFASFSRHSKEKPTKRKRPLNTDRQSHNIKKRCCTHALPNISASAGCSGNNESTAWKKPSCTYTASSATQEAMSSQRSSPTKKAATETRKQVYGYRRQRILRKNLQDCYDVNDDASSLERQQGHIVGCVIPASMSMSTSSSKLSVGASKEDFEGKPRWYRRLMTEDYLTGRKLGAQMVKWTDDLWNIKNAEQGQNAKCCSTALGSVDSEPSASVTTATTTSAVSSDNEDVETCQHDVAAVSRMETNVQNPSETDISPAAESTFTRIIDRPPAGSLAVSDIDSNCDSGTVEILPMCEDYRSVLEDSQPLYDPKAGLFGTCSWDDRDANCLRLSYCPPIEIDLTQDVDITNSCLAIGGQRQKTPEFIDLTELQELSEQDAWSETGTDSGIGEPRMMFDPPSLSRSSDMPPLLSRAPDGPPVLTPSVTLPQEPSSEYEYGGRVYHAPLVHVGYFTLGPVTSYR